MDLYCLQWQKKAKSEKVLEYLAPHIQNHGHANYASRMVSSVGGSREYVAEQEASSNGWYGKFARKYGMDEWHGNLDMVLEDVRSPIRGDAKWDELSLAQVNAQKDTSPEFVLSSRDPEPLIVPTFESEDLGKTYFTTRAQFRSAPSYSDEGLGGLYEAFNISGDFYLGLDEWIGNTPVISHRQAPIDLFISKISHLSGQERMRALGHFEQQDYLAKGHMTLEDAEKLAQLYENKK
jgi:hypothetical protein